MDRKTGDIAHRSFQDLADYLSPGDVVVLNNSKVIPARLRGRNSVTGGQFEILLLEENAVNDWWVMVRPGKRARTGTVMTLTDGSGGPSGIRATVVDTNDEGHRRLCFDGVANLLERLDALGEVPVPPYIRREGVGMRTLDLDRYQTLYAEHPGSVAAPTAGLHFTESMLRRLANSHVNLCFVTLHVGLGTFAPVKAQVIEHHHMHAERYQMSRETAETIAAAKAQGRRVLAVGTTTVRVLESVAQTRPQGSVGGSGKTRIFIHPPAEFRIVDALLTNFHLPRSTLLMLVSAFAAPGTVAGREAILKAYGEAIRERYRFFSYGDAMLIL